MGWQISRFYLDWKVVVATKQRFDDMKDISVHPFWRQPMSRAKRLSELDRQVGEKSSPLPTSEACLCALSGVV